MWFCPCSVRLTIIYWYYGEKILNGRWNLEFKYKTWELTSCGPFCTNKNVRERLEMTGHSPARSWIIFLISFDVIALFTFPSPMTQGWLVSVPRKSSGSKSIKFFVKAWSCTHLCQCFLVGLVQPRHVTLNTCTCIFWSHKLSALFFSWKVFSSNFGKQTF